MATAHLLHGFLGTGKTTFARALEARHRALRFTHDEWMATLYGPDPPAELFADCYARVARLMEPLWQRCLALGTDVVFDAGLWSRAERDALRGMVAGLGASAVLYRLTCPDDVARARIEARNRAGQGLYIAPETYDALKSRFEPLGSDEPCVDVPRAGPDSGQPSQG